MARTRKIIADDILDAAERVVTRSGAAGLSIDAVAQEAGVSKSRVVYDHKCKADLLEALVDRQVASERERIAKAIAEHADTPHPELFARIAVYGQKPNDTDKAVVLALSASMPGQEELQTRMREWAATALNDMDRGPRPKAALMAFLALNGLSCLELFGFHQWDETERSAILDGIRTIYASFPEDQ
jgi:AcrR family transcriptional regulator